MADGVSGSMRSLRQGMPFCVPSWVLCLLSGSPPPPCRACLGAWRWARRSPCGFCRICMRSTIARSRIVTQPSSGQGLGAGVQSDRADCLPPGSLQ